MLVCAIIEKCFISTRTIWGNLFESLGFVYMQLIFFFLNLVIYFSLDYILFYAVKII